MNNTECKHTMVISMGNVTKCTICKSYVKFVDGKHIVVDDEDSQITATLEAIEFSLLNVKNTSREKANNYVYDLQDHDVIDIYELAKEYGVFIEHIINPIYPKLTLLKQTIGQEIRDCIHELYNQWLDYEGGIDETGFDLAYDRLIQLFKDFSSNKTA